MEVAFVVLLIACGIGAAVAEEECYYSDGRVLTCFACCLTDCCDSTSDDNEYAIIGGVVGLVAIVGGVIACCVCCIRRRRGAQGVVVTHGHPVTVITSTQRVDPYHAGYNQAPTV